MTAHRGEPSSAGHEAQHGLVLQQERRVISRPTITESSNRLEYLRITRRWLLVERCSEGACIGGYVRQTKATKPIQVL